MTRGVYDAFRYLSNGGPQGLLRSWKHSQIRLAKHLDASYLSFNRLPASLAQSSFSISKAKTRTSFERPSCKGDFGFIPRNTMAVAGDGKS
jgi:hypothetical protein